MIYFSSDFHYNHLNITGSLVSSWKSGYRDFNSVHEMNEAILSSVNSTVNYDDELYFLGDFCFGDRSKIPYFRSRINCQTIYFIRGNHDHNIDKYSDCFTWIKDYHEFYYNKTMFCLFHYPMAVWNGSHKGSINCCGHSHGTFLPSRPESKKGKLLDVGWDVFRKPVSIEEVLKIMDKKDVAFLDHHDKNTNVR